MMKKLFFLFYFLVCVMVASAEQGETIVQNGIYYYVHTENATTKNVEVVPHPNVDTPYSGAIVIPATITHNDVTYDVTRIANRAFNGCSELTSISLPENLLEIGWGAFQNSGLTGPLVLPNTLTTINSYAFQNCSNITGELVIPASVTKIDTYAFADCVNLTGELIIPSNVATLNGYAFSGCMGLTGITLLGEKKTMGAYIFQNCTGVTTFTIDENWKTGLAEGLLKGSGLIELIIPNKVTSIGKAAFQSCKALTTVTIGESITSIGANAFENSSNIKTVDIQSAVLTSISQMAFNGCSSIETMNFPASVRTMGAYVFAGCKSWNGDLVLPEGLTSLPNYAFYNCASLTSVKLPSTLKTTGPLAFGGCASITEIVIPASVTTFGTQLFNGCTSLKTLVFEENSQLTTIPRQTFISCPLEGDLVLPESITKIDEKAFRGCSKLTSITIGNNVTSIGYEAFYGCSSVKSVIIGNSVTSIGDNTFNGCSNLESLTLGSSLKTIGSNAFINCTKLAGELVFPSTLTSVGYRAFQSCSSISSIVFENSAASIGEQAFRYCYGLTSLYLGEQMVTIGKDAFASCNKLAGELIIPHTVTTLGLNAFNGCSSLTTVTLGNGVTTLGNTPFSGCSGLTRPVYNTHLFVHMPTTYVPEGKTAPCVYEIPVGIQTIAACAFDKCKQFSSIIIPEGVTTINNYAFRDCKELVYAPLPESVTTIGEGIFHGCTKLGQPIIQDGVLVYMPNAYIQANCSDGVYELPEDVHTIGGYAFSGCTSLTKVEVHEGLREIGLDAFSGCTNLKHPIYNTTLFAYMPPTYNDGQPYEYTMPLPTITQIASYAFRDCKNLTKITISENVASIDTKPFVGCTQLTSVVWDAKNCLTNTPFSDIAGNITSFTFGNTVEHIPGYLCNGMNKLTSIVISNSVKTIGERVWYNCKGIVDLTIGENVESIAARAFGHLPLTTVTWNAKNATISTDAIFYSVESITTFNFGNAVEHIPASLCASMKLTKVTIPENVVTIGKSAFNECTLLTEVVWNARECTYSDDASNPFPSSTLLEKVTFGNAVQKIVPYMCSGKTKITSIAIPESVKTIGVYAFNGCTGLTSVIIPNSVTTLGKVAFNGCTALKTVTLSNSLTMLADNVFAGCYSLGSIDIPNSVTSLSKDVFKNCVGLTSVVIPANIQSVNSSAFSGCTGLRKIMWNAKTYVDGTDKNSSPFYGVRTYISSVVFGETVEHIPAFMCYEMTNLTHTVLPSSVVSVGQQAFNLCSNLTDAYYTGDLASWCGVEFGSESANPIYNAKTVYINGETITDLVIPESVTAIGNYTFANCESITSARIGNNVTTIGKSAFSSCVNMQSISIGESVRTIGTNAFNKCVGLREIIWNPILHDDYAGNTVSPFYPIRSNITSFVFGNSVEHIPSYLCFQQQYLKSITIPSSVTSIGTGVFDQCYALSKLNYTGTIADWCAIDFASIKSNPMYYTKDIYINDAQIVDLIIPASVTNIGQYAFYRCEGIKTVALQHTELPLPTVGTEGFTETITNVATLLTHCDLVDAVTTTTPWSSFRYKGSFGVYITVLTNNAAYGTARATKQPDCDGNGGKIVATPATNCRFLGWDDGNTDNPRTLDNVAGDMTFTAIFAPYITVTTDGNVSDLTWGDNQTDLSDCDIVVADGATLICDVTTTVKNITIQAGGKLVVADGNTLTVTEVFTAQSKDDEQPQILTEGTGAIAYGDFQFVKNIPADRYYFFSLPFESETSNVTIDNGTGGQKNAAYNSDWNYLYYDGAGFAQNPSNDSYWMDASEGTITANQGYAVGVDAATADTYRDLVFKPSSTVDFSLGKAHTVAVAENPLRGDYVHPHKDTFKGWNFIMNPYTSNFGPTTGSLTIDGLEGDVMVSIPKPGQNQTYTQCLFSELGTDTELLKAGVDALEPFYGFFVQVTSDCNVVFAPHGATRAAAPSANRTAHTAPRYIGVQLSNDTHSDATTLVVGEQFTTDYEIGSDLMKMIGYGNEPQVYTYNGSTKYAFKSINEATAAQVQPMGVYLPAMGTYTFSLRDKHVAQAVYLYDYEANTVTNLAETDYTFTSGRLNSEKRFAISAAFAPSQTTALPSADATAAFTVHQDGDLHITLQGVAAGDNIRIINVHGQVVMQWTATDTTTEADLPQAGLYIIERTSAMGIQVNKIIL